MKTITSLAVVALSLTLTAIHAVAQPANDNFANSIPLEVTNIAVTANLIGSTIEPGETPPAAGAANDIIADRSVWYSWAAPATGRAYFTTTPHWVSQYVVIYTGTSLANLQRVPLVIYASNRTFMTQEGTVYHIQIGSFSPNGETSVAFNLELRPEVPADNDLFSSAVPLQGNPWYTGGPMPPLHWLLGAGTELGEPAHLGETPAKSLWWKWQAPYFGTLNVNSTVSTATNVVICIYQGSTLATLKLLKKGTNTASLTSIIAGEDYYVATAVPTNATGDVFLTGTSSAQSTFHPVPGNVLLNPSFEQGVLFDFWSVSGTYGGFVGENGGADGRSWPVLSPGTKIWQEFATVPGHQYRIRFIWRFGGDLSGGAGARSFRVLWNTNQVAIAQIPADEPYWHCPTFYTVAPTTTSRFTLENLAGNTDVDGCSVVDVTAAPEIVTQPKSISTVAGGTAGFVVGVTGSDPLTYQWFFNGSALSGETTKLLELQSVSTNQAGPYHVTVSNGFGSVTSAIANLIVEAPDAPVILYQPLSESVAVGAFVQLSVVAGGTSPLQYQWFFNDAPMAGFTNRFVTFDSIQLSNAGTYRALVQNNAGSALSLPATIQVSGTNVGGALIDFRNRATFGSFSNAPVFNTDGFTLLNGSNFVAQLYAGPSLAELRPAGQPSPFNSGFNAGYFVARIVALPNIAPGSNVVVQVRAWEQTKGLSYEEARALGGKYGKSGILNLTTGSPLAPPTKLLGLQSFSLQAGLPFFSAGIIRMVERQPGNILVWALDGEPNSRYVIEKAVQNFNWEPFVVVTNVTGTVTFSDSANSGAHNVFFRARILD
jgi:hypothetical protein